MRTQHLIGIISVLFVTLQGIIAWQGQRMVNGIDQLTEAVTDSKVNQAAFREALKSQGERLAQLDADNDERAKGTDLALRALSGETRDLDRRVTKLENTQ